ncbi:MAG: hypothetical protein RIB98_13510 [Acidimicrobiales bacterium]
MSHIVIHDDNDDVTHYVEFDDVQEAASYLEELVTDDEGTNARLFALEPVQFAVKSYVRIEIGAADTTSATTATAAQVVPARADAAQAADDYTADENPIVDGEVFTDEPDDEVIEYVEASVVPVDPFAPDEVGTRRSDESPAGDSRRGLFGR